MIESLAMRMALCICAMGLVFSAWGQQSYPLSTGEALTGEPVHADINGVVFKRPDGNLTTRFAWTNFTQAALKELAKNPQAKPLVEPMLDIEEDLPSAPKKARPVITAKIPTRIDRPDPKAGWGNLFTSPLSATLLVLVYLANLYAAYEISLFRRYHPGLVIGVAAVVPIIGPLIFFCVPTHLIVGELAPEEEVVEESPVEAAPVEVAPVEAAPAEAEKQVSTIPQTIIYRRGETMFNRRFFETKLAGFLRTVPNEAEKDLVVYVKSARGEHVGPRITRVMANELMLHVVKGGASADVIIPFTEIQEVQVRHKDA